MKKDKINEEFRLNRNKHPYYDSDKKQKTEEFAMRAIAWSILGIITLMIVATLWK
jgi:hypothetical protein